MAEDVGSPSISSSSQAQWHGIAPVTGAVTDHQHSNDADGGTPQHQQHQQQHTGPPPTSTTTTTTTTASGASRNAGITTRKSATSTRVAPSIPIPASGVGSTLRRTASSNIQAALRRLEASQAVASRWQVCIVALSLVLHVIQMEVSWAQNTVPQTNSRTCRAFQGSELRSVNSTCEL